jgi:hypothetical protein
MIITENKFKTDTKPSSKLDFLLENFVDKFTFKDREIIINQNVVFISHKHGEVEYVYRLKSLLKQYGFDGYVDWEDDSLPKETSGETASKLKEKILHSKKFILLATNSAINSKWCNWELGFADPHKYIDRIALFALKPDSNNYEGEEYLQIYPSIQAIDNNNNTGLNYYISYPNGKTESISDWLKL